VSLLLGIDVGTSTTKAALVTGAGEIVATAARAHSLSMPRPGWFEQDADAVWWAEVADLSRELTEGRAGELAAVCVSGMGPCVLVADAEGQPLRPAILYGIDTRATAEIAELEAELGAAAVLERCGSPLTSQAVGPKLLWLRNHEPETAEIARQLLMPSSYAVQRLTGAYVLDHHSASQCTPLYDLRAGAWLAGAWERIASGMKQPRLLWPTDVAGEVTPTAAEQTGIPAGTPVAAGTIDAWAEAVSAGLRKPGDLMLMYGSTMFLIGLAAEAHPDRHLWLTRWAFPRGYSRAAGLATSGALTDWFATLAARSYEELAEEAARVPAGADGLVALPYFAGERTPLFDPLARGVLCGLHLGHERGHVYRALLEGTAFGVRHNLEAMAEAGDPVERVVAVGGGTQAPLWTQIVSDVTGQAQELPGETIGASYGDALLAAIAVGLSTPETDWNPVERTVEPDGAAAGVYDELYAVYRRLYGSTRDIAHELARMQTIRQELGVG
jgi:xylulokinase